MQVFKRFKSTYNLCSCTLYIHEQLNSHSSHVCMRVEINMIITWFDFAAGQSIMEAEQGKNKQRFKHQICIAMSIMRHINAAFAITVDQRGARKRATQIVSI